MVLPTAKLARARQSRAKAFRQKQLSPAYINSLERGYFCLALIGILTITRVNAWTILMGDTSENKKDSVEELAGVPAGEEVTLTDGTPTGEIVVEDTDKDGNVIGWHKEAKEAK